MVGEVGSVEEFFSYIPEHFIAKYPIFEYTSRLMLPNPKY